MKEFCMKRFIIFVASLLLCSALIAQSLTGYDVMKRADEKPSPKTTSFTATMTLTDRKGQVRIREIIERSKDYGNLSKSVIVFTSPKDVSGVGYLMFDYDEKSDGTKPDSDRWLYMPAMKKTRRISGSDSGGDFMGTDFTYDDLGERGLSKDTYTLLGEENLDGEDCYKVECKSKDSKEKDQRKICWVTKDNYLMLKAEFYDRQDMLHRVLTISDYKKKDGYWVSGKMLMKNVQTAHSTLLEMKNTEYDKPMDDSPFTVASLENGRIR